MGMTRIGFQDKAVKDLTDAFQKLWNAPGTMLPLVFKSPTGSGKTYMTERFIQELSSVGGFNEDVAWIWITFSDELAMQSREKFEQYFSPAIGRRLLTVADFSDGVLRQDDVLFLNWQKLVANDAEARVLRRPDDPTKRKETGYYFEDVVEATHKAGRTIVMVIDESHKNVSELAEEKVIAPADPKVIIKVSATPKDEPKASDLTHNRAGFVEVEREEVVAAGLVKEAIASQTKEEIERGSAEADLDAKLMDLAIKKRDELRAEWKKAGSNVNPLILVQLPDEKKVDGASGQIKKDVVIEYLKKHGIDEDKIANWFDMDKELDKLKFIAENDSPIEFLLFKQAAGTGWDCPRAQILVMYRDIKSPIFKTQTLGRIIRNPEPGMDLKAYPLLRKGYLYTNYSSAEVKAGDKDKTNSPLLTKKSELVIPIKDGEESIVVHPNMTTDFVSRADYGDLGKASQFQECFSSEMDKFFGITNSDFGSARSSKIAAKGVSLAQSVKNNIATNFVITYKSLTDEEGAGSDIDDEMSANDTQKLFVTACRGMLEVQTDEASRVGNIARSEGIFRTAMRNWLKEALPDVASEIGRYKIFLSDVALSSGSVLLSAVTAALKAYAPIRQKNVSERKKKAAEQPSIVFTLKKTYEYSGEHEEYIDAKGITPKLCAEKPLYLLPNYHGKGNETEFIAFLEGNGDKIEWWFKNGDEGKDAFGVKYFNTTEKEERLFHPDWIVRLKDGRIGIFDTKAGSTAKNPEGREKGLAGKIKSMNNEAGSEVFWGGLTVKENGLWYWHDGNNYSYTPGKIDERWKPLSF